MCLNLANGCCQMTSLKNKKALSLNDTVRCALSFQTKNIPTFLNFFGNPKILFRSKMKKVFFSSFSEGRIDNFPAHGFILCAHTKKWRRIRLFNSSNNSVICPLLRTIRNNFSAYLIRVLLELTKTMFVNVH